ncbi:MAG: response regulator, partial [Pseudomonadota bacterium]
TGIGIPADKVDTIFEKFSQVDTSATRRHEGTGLGLAITSKLVEMMDGEIGVRSKVGEGSVFWFAIDIEVDETVVRKIKTVPVDVSGSRVLIIDDNPVNRDILMEQMEAWAFDAFAVESGHLGVSMLFEAARLGTPADLVIVDYQMPGMTGEEVVRHIRNNADTADIPIIVLTSVDQALQPMTLKELRVNHHLLKPARSSQLLECIVSSLQIANGSQTDDDTTSTIEDEAARAWLSASTARSTAQPKPVPPMRKAPFQAEPTQPPVVQPAPASVSAPPQVLTPAPAKAQPSVEAQRVASAEAAPSSAPQRGHGIDVLIAEDNEVNQLVYGQIFAQLDYTYEIVDNGQKAVEAVENLNPAIVLMDVSMPVMNGLEATEKLRENGHASLPIIGVTAHALKGDKEKCLEAGMTDYLPKPISPDRLEAKISQWLPSTKSEVA